MNRIEPDGLWIGNARDGRAFETLFEHGIGAIVQVALDEEPLRPPRDFISLRFPLVDGAGNDPAVVELAIGSVVSLLQQAIPALVCCGGGMSRSPAIAAAALGIVKHVPIEDALKCISRFRQTDISPGLWADIVACPGRKA